MCQITHTDAHLAARLTESEAENDQWQKKLAETWTELAEERQWREDLADLSVDQQREIERLKAENEWLRRNIPAESVNMNNWQVRYREWREAGMPDEPSQS